MLKRQCNTTMTEEKRTYERIINRVTDQLMKLTIGQVKEYEKVLFFADPHFLFLIPDAHLAHCLLPTLLNNRLISKVVFNSIKGNNLVTL